MTWPFPLGAPPAHAMLAAAPQPEQQQEPVAHCEGGPDVCPVCRAETRSLALAAAIGYVQRNTPTLVSTEICNALNHIPDATKMVAEPEQPAQQEPVAKDNSNYRFDPPGLDPLYTPPQPAQQEPWPEEPAGHKAGGVQLSGTSKSKAITELYALFGAPHNADINLTGLNMLLDALIASPPPQRTWVGLVWGELPEDGHDHDFLRGAVWAEAKLKEKNT